MSVVFCVPWDSDFDTCIPDGDSPEVSAGTIDTTEYKFVGSLKSAASGANTWAQADFHDLTVLPGNEGACGLWMKNESASGFGLFRLKRAAGNIAYIRITWSISFIGGNWQYGFSLRMYDDGAVLIINTGITIVEPDITDWHYMELDWLWNSGSGNTQFFWDGVEKYSSAAGNTKTRSTNVDRIRANNYSISGGSGSGNAWFDDLVIFDERWHTSNFTPPAVAQCCAAAPAVCECDDEVYRAVLDLKDSLNDTQIRQDRWL